VLNFVVIGGSVAGIACLEELRRHFLEINEIKLDENCLNYRLILISCSSALKSVSKVVQITEHVKEVEVNERCLPEFSELYPDVHFIQGRVSAVDQNANTVYLEDGQTILYYKLAVCSGGRPLLAIENHPNVIGIRDTQSLAELRARLSLARCVIVLGNGGIAMELVHAIDFCEVVWVVKHNYIGNTFF